MIVRDAVPDLVGSALLVAVTVAFVLELTVGAVYMPLLLMVPLDADHVTAVLDVLLTMAVNCTVCEDATVAVPGVTVTLTDVPLDTVIWNEFEPVRPVESVACTVNVYDPDLVGVPEIVPELWPRARP